MMLPLSEGAEEEEHRRDGGEAGAESVHEVENTHRVPHVARRANAVPYEERERAPHEGGRDEDEQKRDEERLERRQAQGERPHPVEERERYETEEADAELDEREQEERRTTRVLRDLSAEDAADSEAEHEGGHDDGDRLDVDAEDGEERSLPHDLIEQGREAREDEDGIDPRHPATPPSLAP